MDEAKETERFIAEYGEAPDGVQYPMKRTIYDAHKHGFLTARKLDRTEKATTLLKESLVPMAPSERRGWVQRVDAFLAEQDDANE